LIDANSERAGSKLARIWTDFADSTEPQSFSNTTPNEVSQITGEKDMGNCFQLTT
jgi:hypothetical protein